MSRFPPFVIYLSPALKRVFMHAADYAHKSLSEHVRDLLAADVEFRASQGEPHFDNLQVELREALEANRLREVEIKTRPRPSRRKEAREIDSDKSGPPAIQTTPVHSDSK